MPEVLDERIKSLVVELVESNPPPLPTSMLNRRRPVGWFARIPRSGPILMVTVAALVLLAGLVGGLIGRNLAPADDAPVSTDTGEVIDVVPLDNSHPAMRLLNEGATSFQSFAAAASDQELDFVCASGGGTPGWELCLLAADGVLAVVPFNGPIGLVARLEGGYLTKGVLIRLHTSDPVGVPDSGPGATVSIEYLGENIGQTSAPWSSPEP